MARFVNLHDAGRALAAHLKGQILPVLSDVLAAPPIENAAVQGEALRVSFLWATPQPTHRNDSWVVGDDGQNRPPPVSLSLYFLVTAYGTSSASEPVQALNRLGQAIQALETEPVIELPIPAAPGIDPVAGSGRLNATLVPVAADLMEKIFTPLQMRHRPWALVELGPVQLERLIAPLPAPDIVAPGGVRLVGPAPIVRPAITGLHPAPLGVGRRLRIETVQAADATGLRIGAEVFTFADVPAAPGQIARPDALGLVHATYPATSAAGAVDVVLTGPGGSSDRRPVTITAATIAALDALVQPLAVGANLVLTGAGLAAVDRVFLWPASGILSPAEVIDLPPSAAVAGQVTVARAGLDAAGLRPIPYLAAARLGANRFTPAVVVEVAR